MFEKIYTGWFSKNKNTYEVLERNINSEIISNIVDKFMQQEVIRINKIMDRFRERERQEKLLTEYIFQLSFNSIKKEQTKNIFVNADTLDKDWWYDNKTRQIVDKIKHHKQLFNNKNNIFLFLNSINDMEIKVKYLYHIAKIMELNCHDLNLEALKLQDVIAEHNLLPGDAYIYFTEKDYIQKGLLSPLGNFIVSFYGVYKRMELTTPEAIIKIPNEVLNKIAFYCIDIPNFEGKNLESVNNNLFSERGLNKVVDLWIKRLDSVLSTQEVSRLDVRYTNKTIIPYVLGLITVMTLPFLPFNTTAMITICGGALLAMALGENLSAVISNPINYIYNSIGNSVRNITERAGDHQLRIL